MYRPKNIISTNTKCSASIDLPVEKHCEPTKRCLKDCYARSGHQARPNARRKQKWVSDLLAHPKDDDMKQLVIECSPFKAVRLNGSGDLNQEHLEGLISLAKQIPDTRFWGMTRKPDIAKQVNEATQNLSLLLSVDVTSPESVWNYEGKMCYGPRHPEDEVPNDDRIVTVFPRHCTGRVIKGMPRHPKDCLGVYHEIPGCMVCGRCWKWK